MPLHDTKGVPWAHSDTCKAGDQLKCDGGFTCIETGAVVTVHANKGGELFVPCADGQHYLIGQVGEDGELVGMYSAGGQREASR